MTFLSEDGARPVRGRAAAPKTRSEPRARRLKTAIGGDSEDAFVDIRQI